MGTMVYLVRDGELTLTQFDGGVKEGAATLAGTGELVWVDARWRDELEEHNLLSRHYESEYGVNPEHLEALGDGLLERMKTGKLFVDPLKVRVSDDLRSLFDYELDGETVDVTMRMSDIETFAEKSVIVECDGESLGWVKIVGNYIRAYPSDVGGKRKEQIANQLLVTAGAEILRRGRDINSVLDFQFDESADEKLVVHRGRGSQPYPAGLIRHKDVSVVYVDGHKRRVEPLSNLISNMTTADFSKDVWELSKHLAALSELPIVGVVDKKASMRVYDLEESLSGLGVPFINVIDSDGRVPQEALLECYRSFDSLMGQRRVMPFTATIAQGSAGDKTVFRMKFDRMTGIKSLLGHVRVEGSVVVQDDAIRVKFRPVDTKGKVYAVKMCDSFPTLTGSSFDDTHGVRMLVSEYEHEWTRGNFEHTLYQTAVAAINHMASTADQWSEEAYDVTPAEIRLSHSMGEYVAYFQREALTQLPERTVESPGLLPPKSATEDARIRGLREKLSKVDFTIYGDVERQRLELHIGNVADVLSQSGDLTSEQKVRLKNVIEKIENKLDQMSQVTDKGNGLEVSLRVLEMEYDDQTL